MHSGRLPRERERLQKPGAQLAQVLTEPWRTSSLPLKCFCHPRSSLWKWYATVGMHGVVPGDLVSFGTRLSLGKRTATLLLIHFVSYDSRVPFCVRWAGDNGKREGRLRATEQSSAFNFPSEDMEQSSACFDSLGFMWHRASAPWSFGISLTSLGDAEGVPPPVTQQGHPRHSHCASHKHRETVGKQ